MRFLGRFRQDVQTWTYIALIGAILFLGSAVAIVHNPTIPRFEQGARVASLSAAGDCARVLEHVLLSNQVTPVAADAADIVLLILGSVRPVLSGPYLDIETLAADVQARSNEKCDVGQPDRTVPDVSGAIYVFERKRDGKWHRTFFSVPQCVDFGTGATNTSKDMQCLEWVLISGTVLVQFREDTSREDIKSFLSEYGLTSSKVVEESEA
jgi:hypothetical protein